MNSHPFGRAVSLTRGQRVEVEWEDIQDYADDDWNEDPDYYDTASIRSVLYVAFDYTGGRVLLVAKDWDIDNGVPRGVRTIPPGCVTSVRSCITGEELWDLPHADEEARDRTLQSGALLGRKAYETVYSYEAAWPPGEAKRNDEPEADPPPPSESR